MRWKESFQERVSIPLVTADSEASLLRKLHVRCKVPAVLLRRRLSQGESLRRA